MRFRVRGVVGVLMLCGLAGWAITASRADTTVGTDWQEMAVVMAPGSGDPFPRASFAAASHPKGKGSGWMFGGVLDDFTENPVYNNELFRLDPIGNSVVCSQIVTNGPEPTARAFPALAVVDGGDHEDVYLFGGGTFPFDLPFPSNDKFWKYDEGSETWTDLSALGGPSARMGATMVTHKNSLYVFGGIAFHPVFFFELFNDLWKFDTTTQTWTELSTGVGPAPRHVAMGATIDDEQLLIFGGERVEIDFNDFSITFPIDTTTWTWDLDNGGWTQREDGPERNYSAFGDGGDNFIIFGGDSPGGEVCTGAPFAQNPTNDAFTYDPVEGWMPVFAGSLPDEVKRPAGFVLNHEFYNLGGFDFTCEDGQIFNLKVHRIAFDD